MATNEFITDVEFHGNELLNPQMQQTVPTGANVQQGVFFFDPTTNFGAFFAADGSVIPFHDNSVKTINAGANTTVTPDPANPRLVTIGTDFDLASATAQGLMSAEQFNLLSGSTDAATPGALVLRDAAGNTAVVGFTADNATFGAATVTNDPTGGRDVVPLDFLNTQLAQRDTTINSISRGISTKRSARVLADSSIATTGTPVIDGVQTAVGDRILVNGGINGGIWEIPAGGGAWTRPADPNDYPTGGQAQPGTLVGINEGTANADSLYMMTANAPVTIDTDPTEWTRVGRQFRITQGNGLNVTEGANGESTIAIDNAFTFPSMTFAGDRITPANSVEIQYGGTGAATAAGSRVNLGVPTDFVYTSTDTAVNQITIPHGMGVPLGQMTMSFTLVTPTGRRKVGVRVIEDGANPLNQFTIQIKPTLADLGATALEVQGAVHSVV